MTMRRSTTALAWGTALALGLTACGSDETSGSSDADGGEPIQIMTIGSFSQPPFVLPEIPVGAQAAVNRLNDAGGINGRQIELLTCDDEGNPNGATACARQAVEDEVAAVVGTFTLFGDAIVPLLERGSIPYILPTANSPLEGSSEISFPVMSGATAASGSIVALANAGCERITTLIIDAAPGRAAVESFIAPSAETAGAEFEAAYLPPTTTDVGPVISQSLAGGTDCFNFGVGAQLTSAGLVALSQSGADVTSASNALALPETVMTQIPQESEGFLAVSDFYYPSSGEDVALQVQEDMRAVDPEAPVNDGSINAYAAVLVFAQAAEEASDVTAEGMLEAMRNLGTIDVGLFTPMDFGDAGYIEEAPRVAASTMRVYVAENGTYVPADQADLDLSSILGS